MIVKIKAKPIQKEAVQWTGFNMSDVLKFVGYGNAWKATKGLAVKNKDSVVMVPNGDYIIKGVNGEFYPCSPDVLSKTYDILEFQEEVF